MKIKDIKSQYRRDFTAVYICHCGYEQEGGGYDDHHFHRHVIPNMKCKKCGEIAPPEEYRPLEPKYAANAVV